MTFKWRGGPWKIARWNFSMNRISISDWLSRLLTLILSSFEEERKFVNSCDLPYSFLSLWERTKVRVFELRTCRSLFFEIPRKPNRARRSRSTCRATQ
jgi:hypothetical protein